MLDHDVLNHSAQSTLRKLVTETSHIYAYVLYSIIQVAAL